MLPVTKFFGHDITRVMVGDNPAHSNTYIPDLISWDEMTEYYTHENRVKMLTRAIETGYNTILALASPEMLAVLCQLKNEGKKMHIIFQSYPPDIERFKDAIDNLIEFDPIGIYHQGTTGEALIENEDIDTYLSNVEHIRSKGLPAGMAFHDPANLERAERENWGADFYVLCPYNSRRNRKGEQSSFITGKSKSSLVFHPDDRHTMYPLIRSVKQPVIVIKALAGGQILIGKSKEEYPAVIKEYLTEAFNSIKPIDTICIGVFQRDIDQLKQNADIVSEILRKATLNNI